MMGYNDNMALNYSNFKLAIVIAMFSWVTTPVSWIDNPVWVLSTFVSNKMYPLAGFPIQDTRIGAR